MGPPGHPPRTQARPSFRRSQSPIEIALHLYQRQTGEDILTQAIAVELQSCDSTDAALSLLERQSLSGDARLTGWLRPTVKVLHSLSSSLEKDVRLVIIGPSSCRTCVPYLHSSGIVSRQCYFCCYRCPPLSEDLP